MPIALGTNEMVIPFGKAYLGNKLIYEEAENKPAYVEYIDSTGTQYIDTGVSAYNLNKIKFEVDMSVPSGYPQSFWGPAVYLKRRNSGSYTVYCDTGMVGSTDLSVTSVSRFTGTIEANSKDKTYIRKYVQNGSEKTLNGSLRNDFTKFSNLPIYIFACNSSSGAIEMASTRLYSFKIYSNDVLVRDFKPCQDSKGVYCLYDEVTKAFFYNAGTGEFTGGNVL